MLGLVREMVASYYFGAAGRINAFTVAFQVPNLVRALVADAALSSAFVPVFSDLLEKGERKRAWRVASSLFWLMLLGLTALTALFIVVAPWVIGIFGNPGHDRALAVGLSRVLFPIVALLGVSGIVVGILNSYDHFTGPGALAGLLEPRDHRRPRDRRPAGALVEHEALRLRGLDPRRDGHPGAPADAVAARARPRRGAAARRPRLARPDGQADVRPDGSR